MSEFHISAFRKLADPSYTVQADELHHVHKIMRRELHGEKIMPLLDFLRRDVEAQKSNRVVLSVIYAVLHWLAQHESLYQIIVRRCSKEGLATCVPAIRAEEEAGWMSQEGACYLICEGYIHKDYPKEGIDYLQHRVPPPDYTQRVLRRIDELYPAWKNDFPKEWAEQVTTWGLPVTWPWPLMFPDPRTSQNSNAPKALATTTVPFGIVELKR